jgi:membrane-associated PAP2 superfamily phosphatase
LIPPAWKGPFLRNHFDDTLLIPAALPLILWMQRKLGLRTTDHRPTWSEILLHFVIWSIAAEVVAPHLFANATGDPWDVVAYAGGALAAGLIWHFS